MRLLVLFSLIFTIVSCSSKKETKNFDYDSYNRQLYQSEKSFNELDRQ